VWKISFEYGQEKYIYFKISGFYRFLLARARHTLKLANKEHPLSDARAKHPAGVI
jgi:hypothetical protein